MTQPPTKGSKMPTFETLILRQHELFGLIASAVENLSKIAIEKQTRSGIKIRLTQLDVNWEKFLSIHDKLMNAQSEETRDHIYFTEQLRVKCEEEYLLAKGEFLDRLELFREETTNAEARMCTVAANRTQQRSLPKISLPKFEGNYQQWIPFRDLFQSMIGMNETIPSVEKLHYLKVSVTGDAAKLIANIPITEENYTRAWEKLVARYENKRALVNAQLDILFALKPLARKSSADLEVLRATVAEVLEALEALGGPVDQWDFFLVYFICRRLDAETHEAWELRCGGTTDPPSYASLNTFLETRVRALETVDHRTTTQRSSNPSNFNTRPKLNARVHTVASSSSTCTLCGAAHYIASCPEYRSKNPEQRRELVVQRKLCFNCLGQHKLSACRTPKRCLLCAQQHHTSIHRSISAPLTNTAPASSIASASHEQPRRECSIQNVNVNHASVNHVKTQNTCEKSDVLLATASVIVVSPHGEEFKARALLDQGSELSFVRESLVQALRLPRHHAAVSLFGIGAQRSTTTRGMVPLTIRGHYDPNFELALTAFVLPHLTRRIPATTVNVQGLNHIAGLELADPSFAIPGQIDIILGADIYGRLLEAEIRKGAIDAPVAQRTSLGWIISGPTPHAANNSIISATSQGLNCTLDSELHELVHRFWRQEEVQPSLHSMISTEDILCERHFMSTHSRDSSGRYIVRLPFKKTPIDYGNSRILAARMMTRMQQKLISNSVFRNLYVEFLAEYERLGHMTCLNNNIEDSCDAFYLPHHGVLRESSSTTKLRVVFNGSQKTNHGFSLNDCLHTGAKIQPDLVDVILRWRRHMYVFSADVEKMFRQILVHPKDRKHQRILWNDGKTGPWKTYELNTVTYGLACAPFLAVRVLRQLADDEGALFPLAAEVLRRDVYVDDVLSGADDIKGCQERVKQLNGLLTAGGFCLKKWAANDNTILESIDIEKRETLSNRDLNGNFILRALGLTWSPATDAFLFTSHLDQNSTKPTKRIVLSNIARLFDPLGWIAPVVIRAKIFLQRLWTANLDWDDHLPEDYALQWHRFTQEFEEISKFSVPRWFGLHASLLAVEIHGFSDASQDALGAVIYLRAMTDFDDVRISLVIAKTRVAPLKHTTIPRLELAAAVLLAQLVVRIRSVIDLNHAPVHLWTDSTVALTWIKGHPSRWKEYVANRVSHIQEILSDGRWHHIAGRDNPADAASRGLSPTQLCNHETWWHGPSWLAQPSSSWPSSTPLLSRDANLEERPAMAHVTISNPEENIWDLVHRYSSLKRLLRITAWLFRVVATLRDRQNKKGLLPLTPSELETARIFWLKITQHAYFGQEISTLKRGSELPRSNALLQLTPFVDHADILRIGGRLRNAVLDPDTKHPAILPRHSTLSTLIIRDAHIQTLHGGVQVTLTTIRRSIWIIGGRAPIRAFILRCVPCTRQRAKTAKQLMGQLPPSRTTPSRPFLNTGVDLAGPFTVKAWKGRGAKTYKAYLVVFVCFATSAVHLELATDYSTQGFLAAYRRFTGRRGRCATITSDCGTNLVGADAELRQLFNSASKEWANLAHLLASDNTEWKFHPPATPHFGGKWEAAVKSTKFHLRRVIGDTLLTYEEFSTLLAQIEQILNSRPLCPVSDDPTDVDALTPGHFLVGGPLNAVPEPSLENVPTSRLSHWQRVRQMTEGFWKRWSSEYIQRLQGISKWQHQTDPIKVGALVLISDERYPPTKWPLARVINVHPGLDGLTRVVTVKTATSTLRRPIVKLCPLPVITAIT